MDWIDRGDKIYHFRIFSAPLSSKNFAKNFANDVFDYEKGADTEERLGPTRAVAAGLLSPGAVRLGMIVAFLFATLCGVYLTWISGPVIVAIGVLSIASGILYTAGPYPLAYVGLGDVFVILFFGVVAVLGTSYVQTDAVTVRGALASTSGLDFQDGRLVPHVGGRVDGRAAHPCDAEHVALGLYESEGEGEREQGCDVFHAVPPRCS